MIQRIIATGFLGYHFVKTLFCRIFRIRQRGLAEFRNDYNIR